MILPTQRAAGMAALSLVQSTLDDIEKRRVEQEKKVKGDKDEDKVLKAKISADGTQRAANDKINEHFFNRDIIDINEMKVQFVEKLGGILGLERGEDQSGFSYGRQLESAIAQLDSQELLALERKLGLKELDISLDEVIKAIKNPYGDEDDKLEAALEKRATGQSTTRAETGKVAQRLERIADPKTLEELKLEKAEGNPDPTQVDDAQTRAERDGDIEALEAMEKLEDVKDLHQTIQKQNEQALQTGGQEQDGAGGTDPTADAVVTIQVLAAGAEAIKAAPENDAAGKIESVDAVNAEKAIDTGGDAPLSEEDQVSLVALKGPQSRDDAAQSILTIQVDENGIYDVLLRQLAAA